MAEPTITAATVAATISGVTLALFGVDYYSLLYGFVGAIMAMSHAAAMTKGRAVIYVVLSTLVGAVLGNAAIAIFDVSNKAILILGCLVGGAGAQLIVAAALKSILSRIDGWGNK